MVDISTPVLEWKTHSSSYSGHHNRIRRFATGLGSSIGDKQYKRIMVRGRENPTHQHAGADGRSLCNKDLDKGQTEHPRPPEDGQHYSHCLCESHEVPESIPSSMQIMPVVPSERHYSNSLATTRIMQHIGRLEDAAVISGVDVGQLNLWQSTTEVGSMLNRPSLFPD